MPIVSRLDVVVLDQALAARSPTLDMRARSLMMQTLQSMLITMLTSRVMVHGLIVMHLAWLTERLALPGDAFAMDPRQYEYFIARGGEGWWSVVFAIGALLGALGLVTRSRIVRVASAFSMGTVEFTIAHGLTISRAAPTAGPTYGTLAVICGWLILVHWLPNRLPDFKG